MTYPTKETIGDRTTSQDLSDRKLHFGAKRRVFVMMYVRKSEVLNKFQIFIVQRYYKVLYGLLNMN